MDAKKVLEVLDTYGKLLATCKLHNLDNSVIDVRPERADPTKRYSLFLDSGDDWLTKMNHLAWAVEQCRGFVNAGRMEKAFRWLGFLQGALWFAGKYSIDEMAGHNKPAEQEPEDWLGAHADHGLGSVINGPDDPDCPCRGTAEMTTCAFAGCGFCTAALP